MTGWIGETFRSDVGWRHVETLVDIDNRMAGSEGEARAAEETRDALARAGAREARLDPFEIRGWARDSARLRTDDAGFACLALPRSPADEATGPLVDIGYGLPVDFETDLSGAIVMVSSTVPDWSDRFIHRREKYLQAVQSGAAGFVFRNHVEGGLAATGSVGTDPRSIGPIPAVAVSKEVGARLARTATDETVTLGVEATIETATSHNAIASLGPETATEILVTGHVDAHDITEGARDNASGAAMLVELAHILADREADLETRVTFIGFGAEEVGLLGAKYDSTHRDHETIKAVVNNDALAEHRTLELTTHGFAALDDPIETVGSRYNHPIEMVPRLAPHSDHWPYVRRGVPGLLVSCTRSAPGRGWGHTRADTLDKLDVRNFREQAILLAELVMTLADNSVRIPHRPSEAVAAQLEDERLDTGLRIAGEWPYD